MRTAADIARTPHRRLARTAGIVIGRQRPDTASGVVFVTLEDETGCTNVIVWRDLSDRQRRELLGSRLMAVYGTVEREGDVVHLIAGRLVDLTPMLGKLETTSRDFISRHSDEPPPRSEEAAASLRRRGAPPQRGGDRRRALAIAAAADTPTQRPPPQVRGGRPGSSPTRPAPSHPPL